MENDTTKSRAQGGGKRAPAKGASAKGVTAKGAPVKGTAARSGEAAKPARGRHLSFRTRDPEKTKESIILAAIEEFSAYGYEGGRVERIAKSARVNMRMIYHYYENKERLYVSVLERVYRDVRISETELRIEDDPPALGIRKLVNITFDHFAEHPDLISIVMGENLQKAEYLKKSDLVPSMSAQLKKSVATVLERGVAEGIFRQGIDPTQLWLTIFALCWTHLSNRYTMSWTLQFDMADPAWLESRKKHVEDVIIQYLSVPGAAKPARGKRKAPQG